MASEVTREGTGYGRRGVHRAPPRPGSAGTGRRRHGRRRSLDGPAPAPGSVIRTGTGPRRIDPRPRPDGEAAAGTDVIIHEAAPASVEGSFVDQVAYQRGERRGYGRGRACSVPPWCPPGGLRVVVFALRHPDLVALCRDDEAIARVAIWRQQARGRAVSTHRSAGTTGSRPWRFAISTSSAPDMIPASHYAAVIPLFITAVLEGRRPVINGDGSISRDFTYVHNVVAANLPAASAADASRSLDEHRVRRAHLSGRAFGGVPGGSGRTVEAELGPLRDEGWSRDGVD